MSITAITMPKWGLTMTEGKVVGWLKPAGSALRKGDELLEIETSKITNVMEADNDGTLARIVAGEGATLPIGGLLAVVAPAGTADADIEAFVAGFVVPEPESETTEAGAPAPKDIDANGQRIRYLEMGSGDATPAVLLHGFGADLNSWMFTQPILAESRRTIALDLPGHGGSAKSIGAGDVAALSGAVEAALTALGITRAHLVGHSMGGAVATDLSARRPDLVASLTLIAPAGLGAEINGGFIDGFIKASRRKDAEAVLKLLVHDPALVSRQMVEDVLRYKRIDGATAALETIAAAWFPGGRQAVDQRAMVAALPMPVQVIWGRADGIVPVAHAGAAGRPAHVLAGAGHIPHMEKSGAVGQLIQRFIEA